jgi:hypothetical protein
MSVTVHVTPTSCPTLPCRRRDACFNGKRNCEPDPNSIKCTSPKLMCRWQINRTKRLDRRVDRNALKKIKGGPTHRCRLCLLARPPTVKQPGEDKCHHCGRAVSRRYPTKPGTASSRAHPVAIMQCNKRSCVLFCCVRAVLSTR